MGNAAIPFLADLVFDLKKGWAARMRAAEILAAIGTEDALRVLVETQRSDILMPASLLVNIGSAASDALIAGMQHSENLVRVRSAHILGKLGDESTVSKLREILQGKEVGEEFTKLANWVIKVISNARKHTHDS